MYRVGETGYVPAFSSDYVKEVLLSQASTIRIALASRGLKSIS
jgi:hypothetical protein